MCDLSKYDLQELKNKFLNAEPYNYLVIDNFIEKEVLKSVEEELRNMKKEEWFKKTEIGGINNERDSITQSKKIALNDRNLIKENSNKIIDFFRSEELLKFIQNITDIDELQNDDYLLGGGIHKTETGGRLAIHADFNIHPQTGKHRRINALLYLNSEWKEEYNGQLELWDKNMTQCVKKIEPIFNRLIIFRITDDAFHGHPEIWNAPIDYPRLSFAFYYYTNDRPENEKNNFHWALWQKRYINDY